METMTPEQRAAHEQLVLANLQNSYASVMGEVDQCRAKLQRGLTTQDSAFNHPRHIQKNAARLEELMAQAVEINGRIASLSKKEA